MSRKRVPLNQNECTDDFRIGVPFEQNLQLWRVSEGTNASDKMMAVMNRLDKLFANPLPSFHPRDLLIGVAGGIALRLVVYYKAKNVKKFRQGVEYGSARWSA